MKLNGNETEINKELITQTGIQEMKWKPECIKMAWIERLNEAKWNEDRAAADSRNPASNER